MCGSIFRGLRGQKKAHKKEKHRRSDLRGEWLRPRPPMAPCPTAQHSNTLMLNSQSAFLPCDVFDVKFHAFFLLAPIWEKEK